MLRDFDALKVQLKELAEVVNSFKSEAVQLRVVELVLTGATSGEEEPGAPEIVRRRQAKRRKANSENVDGEGTGDRRPRRGGRGAKATLAKLVDEGFFKKPQTLSVLVQYVETNMASKFQQSDFSGSLARYVRDGKLKRVKNSDGQYEYSEA